MRLVCRHQTNEKGVMQRMRKMQKIRRAVLLALILVFLSAAAAWAVEIPVTLRVNDTDISGDVYSFIEEGRTYVPIRFTSMALNALQIQWDYDTEIALVRFCEETEVRIDVASGTIYRNGVPYDAQGSVLFRDHRLFVPLRDMATLAGASLDWDSRHYVVDLFKDGVEVPEEIIADPIDQKQWLWLSRIVEVETGGNDLQAKLAVANVVLNRVNSSRFPGTVHDVIFEVNTHVQFPPAHRSSFQTLQPSQASWQAAKAAMYGQNNIGGALFFNNRPWSHMSSRFIARIGGNYFYR